MALFTVRLEVASREQYYLYACTNMYVYACTHLFVCNMSVCNYVCAYEKNKDGCDM